MTDVLLPPLLEAAALFLFAVVPCVLWLRFRRVAEDELALRWRLRRIRELAEEEGRHQGRWFQEEDRRLQGRWIDADAP